jgi:carbon storage regulator
MLVLSRREGEAIILETSDGTITVRLTEYNGSQTRVGVDAPASVRVLREELLEESQVN